MNNLEFFLNLSLNKINVILIDKENKKKIFNKDLEIEVEKKKYKVILEDAPLHDPENKIMKD